LTNGRVLALSGYGSTEDLSFEQLVMILQTLLQTNCLKVSRLYFNVNTGKVQWAGLHPPWDIRVYDMPL
jgi:hypothetical protein